ncbi:MAG TPA: nucleoside 2-deoxyribosyltransferase domain-containing protein [Chitinophagaceae bacterium]|nr:nucleoside 2-deoxyribosyltransferase domain-containing protein [Chitinophagaceae bacterium]
MSKVFLGGTCNDSHWREQLIPLLKIEYYNPIVSSWTAEIQKEELHQREICDFCLYVITPKMEGVYSIAEVIDDSNKRPEKTIFCYLDEDDDMKFSATQKKSMDAVCEMIKQNHAKVFSNLNEIADYLNSASIKQLNTQNL